MITEIGHFALILALATAVVQSVVPLIGARRRDERYQRGRGEKTPDFFHGHRFVFEGDFHPPRFRQAAERKKLGRLTGRAFFVSSR